jgi:hypothetical protein
MNDRVRPDGGDNFPLAFRLANVTIEKIERSGFADRFEIGIFQAGE